MTRRSCAIARLLALAWLLLQPAWCETIPAKATVSSSSPPVAGQPWVFNASITPTNTTLAGSPLTVSHERILHVVAIGADLDTFFHVHPEDYPTHDKGAPPYTLNVTLPKAGDYLLGLDAEIAAGSLSNSTKVTATGTPKLGAFSRSRFTGTTVHVQPLPSTAPLPVVSLSALTQMSTNSTSGNNATHYLVELALPYGACIAGRPQTFIWKVLQGDGKTPVTDLTPFLGAYMHLAVASSNLTLLHHGHGVASDGQLPNNSSDCGTVSMSSDGAMTTTKANCTASSGATSDSSPGSMPMRGTTTTSHAGHGRRRRQLLATDMGDMPAANSTFGPYLATEVTVPAAGTYLFVGQLSRGEDVIWAPFYVDCEAMETAMPLVGMPQAQGSPTMKDMAPSTHMGHSRAAARRSGGWWLVLLAAAAVLLPAW